MHHPSEAIQLAGVGPKVVEMITSRLQTWCKNNFEEFPQRGAFIILLAAGLS